MEFRILGPLDVVADGASLPLGGGKQRALLALLLLRPNEPVSVDRLVDELWGERPPPTAAKNVQVYVSHLRKALGDGRDRDDAARLRGPRRRTARSTPQRAAQALAAAAGRPPRSAGSSCDGARRLARPSARGARGRPVCPEPRSGGSRSYGCSSSRAGLEADLELGRQAEILVELERLVAAHPLDERLRAQLMLALYRSGRQADALAGLPRRAARADAGARARAGRGAALARAADPRARPVAAGAAGPRRRPERRSRPGIARRRSACSSSARPAGSRLLCRGVVLALAARRLAGGAGRAANSIAVSTLRRGTVVAAIPVGRRPEEVVAGAGAVWVANVDDRTLSRIDPETLA